MYFLECISCSKKFSSSDVVYTCPDCGDLLGTLDVNHDYSKIKKSLNRKYFSSNKTDSIFRYLSLLPLSDTQLLPGLKIGMTPLLQFQEISAKYKLKGFYFKDDTRNPSLSFKDRATVISLLKAHEFGFEKITSASTGNAAASLACLSASMGVENIIFVPKSIPQAKLLQLQVYGSKIVLVDGSYDDAFDLCGKIASEKGWYNRSTAVNPFNLEGKKTVSFEICEQLNFEVPDYIFVPVGDGCIISGVWKGFVDFYNVSLIDKLPKLIACQAEGSASIANAFLKKLTVPEKVKATTIADSISVELPRDGVKAIRALKQSNGDVSVVRDDEITTAIFDLASQNGIFVEPSSAAAYAGFKKYYLQNKIESGTTVVVLLTGNGMKDLAAAQKSVSGANIITVDPADKSISKKLEKL